MPTEGHYFSFKVKQSPSYEYEQDPETPVPNDNVIPFVLNFFSQIKSLCCADPSQATYDNPEHVHQFELWVSRSQVIDHSRWMHIKTFLTAPLSDGGVPPREHAFISDEVLKAAELAAHDHDLHIVVNITDVTVRPVSQGTMELDLRGDIINRGDPCAICLDDFGGGQSGNAVDAAADIISSNCITRLPCLHYYHRHCIAPWLERHHMCPQCRAYYFSPDDQDPSGGGRPGGGDRRPGGGDRRRGGHGLPPRRSAWR